MRESRVVVKMQTLMRIMVKKVLTSRGGEVWLAVVSVASVVLTVVLAVAAFEVHGEEEEGGAFVGVVRE